MNKVVLADDEASGRLEEPFLTQRQEVTHEGTTVINIKPVIRPEHRPDVHQEHEQP